MVRIRVECNDHNDMEFMYNTLKACALVSKVSMVVDSSGRDDIGYFVEFEGGKE